MALLDDWWVTWKKEPMDDKGFPVDLWHYIGPSGDCYMREQLTYSHWLITSCPGEVDGTEGLVYEGTNRWDGSKAVRERERYLADPLLVLARAGRRLDDG